MSASLILHPVAPDYAPASIPALEAALRHIGLIGEAWAGTVAATDTGTAAQAGREAEPRRYLIGPHFLQLITFMGCAPAIELAPPAAAGAGFCHVSLASPLARPQFRADRQGVRPRCPACRSRIADWPQRVEAWRADPAAQAACPACGELLAVPHIDWRHSAGCARQFVFIHDIYPREALPTEALFTALQGVTGQHWDYFYQQD